MIMIPVVAFIFTLGLAWNPRTEVTLITDTGAEEKLSFEYPVVISKDGDAVLLAESRPSGYPGKSLLPFRRTSFGDITVDCQTDCHEEK